MRALQLLFRNARHPSANRPVKACQNPKDDGEYGGEPEEGHGRAREARRLPQLRALAQRQFELLARRQRDPDLRLACQIVGVAGCDREHVVAVDCDHDEIQDRPLAHDACRRDGLARDALRGRLDPIGRQAREELGAERDDRTVADFQLRRLIGRNPLIGSGRGALSRGRRLRARQAGDAKEEYRDGRSQVA